MGHPQPVLPPLAAESAASARAAELRKDRPRFRLCDCCQEPVQLSDLDADLLCVECRDPVSEPDPDPDNEEPSEGYLRRWEGTFSI
jgi:hypothetical protein